MRQLPYVDLLATYLRPQLRLLVALAALLLTSIVLQVISPQLIGMFVDGALNGAPAQQLLTIAALFLAASVVQQALTVGATYFGERVAWTATNALRADLALHCVSLDAPFHEQRTPGELIERVDGDVTAVASFFSQFIIEIVGNVLLLVGILVMLWTIDARVGIALSVFAALSLLAMLKSRSLAVPAWIRFRETSARLFGFIEEHLNGLEDLRALGAEAHALTRLGQLTLARMRAARSARLLSGVQWSLPIVVGFVSMSLTFAMAVVLVSGGELTIGAAFTLYFYARLLLMPMVRISSQLEEFQRAGAGIVRIGEVRLWRSALKDAADAVSLPSGALSLEFEQVNFAYRRGEPVLREVSFSLRAGATLGLVGRTGSGKTTITRLAVRLWDAVSGEVRIGGFPIGCVERASLRRRIGVVTQHPFLFRASVRDNVTLFDRSLSDDRVVAALMELGIADWARGLPQGLDTLIGAGGRGVSAGEAQLLGLTRVFLRDPGLVILDEPSSRLDLATEQLLRAAIDRLLEGRTGLIVTHRMGMLARADGILELEDGAVVDSTVVAR